MEALSCSVPSPSRSSLFSFAGGHSFRQVRGLTWGATLRNLISKKVEGKGGTPLVSAAGGTRGNRPIGRFPRL